MRLTEFSWSKSDEEGQYKGNEIFSSHIGITSDGQFEMKNAADPSQSVKFSTPEELGEAIAQCLQLRSNH